MHGQDRNADHCCGIAKGIRKIFFTGSCISLEVEYNYESFSLITRGTAKMDKTLTAPVTQTDKQTFAMLDRSRRIYSDTLFSHGDEVFIQHQGEQYRLRHVYLCLQRCNRYRNPRSCLARGWPHARLEDLPWRERAVRCMRMLRQGGAGTSTDAKSGDATSSLKTHSFIRDLA